MQSDAAFARQLFEVGTNIVSSCPFFPFFFSFPEDRRWALFPGAPTQSTLACRTGRGNGETCRNLTNFERAFQTCAKCSSRAAGGSSGGLTVSTGESATSIKVFPTSLKLDRAENARPLTATLPGDRCGLRASARSQPGSKWPNTDTTVYVDFGFCEFS